MNQSVSAGEHAIEFTRPRRHFILSDGETNGLIPVAGATIRPKAKWSPRRNRILHAGFLTACCYQINHTAMDPVSVIGLASSVVGIVEVAIRSISALRALQQRWKAADLTISLLISQLTTLKAALSQIEEWISSSPNAIQHYQLVMDLGASLESCETLLLFIEGQLTRLDWNDSNTLSFESKIKAVLQDKTVKECATHLANQSTALNLLLTALNW